MQLSATLALGDQQQEDIQETIIRYKSAIGINPNNPETRLKLGRAYLMSGDMDNAAEQFRAAIKLAPKNAEGEYGLARVMMRKGEFQVAHDSIATCIRLDPNNAEYHFKFGQILTRQANNDEAIKEFRQAIKLKPDLAGAHRDLGALLGMKGDLDGEIFEEKKAAELQDPDAYYFLGDAYAGKDDRTNAIQSLRKCTQLDPKNALAFRLLAGVLAANHQFPEAIKSAEAAVHLEPDNKSFKNTLNKIRAAYEKAGR